MFKKLSLILCTAMLLFTTITITAYAKPGEDLWKRDGDDIGINAKLYDECEAGFKDTLKKSADQIVSGNNAYEIIKYSERYFQGQIGRLIDDKLITSDIAKEETANSIWLMSPTADYIKCTNDAWLSDSPCNIIIAIINNDNFDASNEEQYNAILHYAQAGSSIDELKSFLDSLNNGETPTDPGEVDTGSDDSEKKQEFLNAVRDNPWYPGGGKNSTQWTNTNDNIFKAELPGGISFQSLFNAFYGSTSYALTQNMSDIFKMEKDNDNSDKGIALLNAPSVWKSVSNIAQAFIGTGGYLGSVTDEQPDDSANTALKRYGFNFPSYAYAGEKAAPVYDLGNLGFNFFDGLRVLGQSIEDAVAKLFGGSVNVELSNATLKDSQAFVGSINYNLHDYPYESYVKEWLGKYWNSEIKDYKKKHLTDVIFNDVGITIDDFAVLEKAKTDYKESGLSENGLLVYKENVDKLYDYLKKNAGDKFSAIMGVIMMSTDSSPAAIYRLMPYSLQDMDSASAELMNGVSDPRTVMFEENSFLWGLFGIVMHHITNTIAGTQLDFIKFISSFAEMLNEFCNFEKVAGWINIETFWNNGVCQMLRYIIALMAIIMVVRWFFKFLIGKAGGKQTFLKCFGGVVILLVVNGLLLSPSKVIEVLTVNADRIVDIGDNILVNDDGFKQLYSPDATPSDISNLKYWYFNLNVWNVYQSGGHALEDSCNIYNPDEYSSEGYGNEYYGLRFDLEHSSLFPTLQYGNDRYPMKSWPVVLLDSFIKGNNNMYRYVDHYMAPRVILEKDPEGDDGKIVWKIAGVYENSNFIKYVQSDLMLFQYIIVAVLILLYTFLKFASFIEFFINLLMLLIKMVVYFLFDGVAGIGDLVKELGVSVLRVLIYNTIVALIIRVSCTATPEAMWVIDILFVAATIGLMHGLIKRKQPAFLMPWLLVLIGTWVKKMEIFAGGIAAGIATNKNNKQEDKELNEAMNDDPTEREDEKDDEDNDANSTDDNELGDTNENDDEGVSSSESLSQDSDTINEQSENNNNDDAKSEVNNIENETTNATPDKENAIEIQEGVNTAKSEVVNNDSATTTDTDNEEIVNDTAQSNESLSNDNQSINTAKNDSVNSNNNDEKADGQLNIKKPENENISQSDNNQSATVNKKPFRLADYQSDSTNADDEVKKFDQDMNEGRLDNNE